MPRFELLSWNHAKLITCQTWGGVSTKIQSCLLH